MLTALTRRSPGTTAVLPDVLRWAAVALACTAGVALAGLYGPTGKLVMLGVALAALASSIAGFAFSAIAGAMLFHIGDPPVRIVQIMMVCSIANQAAMTWAIHRTIEWRALSVLLLSGVVGLAPGIWLLVHADRHFYTHVLGVFLLVYGATMLLRKPITLTHPAIALDLLAGFFGGITGGAAGFPGAAVTVWCSLKGWDKARQRAMFQPFILIMQVIALLGIALAQRGAAQPGFDLTNFLFIPASLLGTMVGLRLYSRLSDLQFGRAVNILLIVSGLSYLV